MSLLLAHGHVHAHRYPVGLVWSEAALVQQRVNADKADAAALVQSAVSSLFSTKAGASFREALKALRDEE